MTYTTEKYCADCEQKLTMEDKVCPMCGSESIDHRITFILEIGVRCGIKTKRPKKPTREYITGDDWYYRLGKWVHKERNIDEEKDQYSEIIKDKITGEVIHKCEEPLSKHRGHGSAKHKKSKSKDNRQTPHDAKSRANARV